MMFSQKSEETFVQEIHILNLQKLFYRCNANKLLERLFLVKNLHISNDDYTHREEDTQA